MVYVQFTKKIFLKLDKGERRGHIKKLYKKIQIRCNTIFFTDRIVNHKNSQSEESVNSNATNIF